MVSFLRALGGGAPRTPLSFQNRMYSYKNLSPSSGLTNLTGDEPWNSTQEGFLWVRATPTDLSAPSGSQYMMDLNNGSSTPAAGIRVDDNDDKPRLRYRDDSGNINADALDEVSVVEGVPRTFGVSWSNPKGKITLSTGGASEVFDFTPDSGVFASDSFSRLYIGSRNGGNEPLTGSVEAFEVGNAYLGQGALSARMVHDDMFVVIGAGQSLMRGHWDSQQSNGNDGYLGFLNTGGAILSGREVLAINGASSGSMLSSRSSSDNHWWDEDTDSPGPAYEFWLDAFRASSLSPQWCFWAQGEGEGNIIDTVDEITRNEYKALLLKVFERMRNDINDTLRIGIQSIGRRESDHSNTGSMQSIREVQQELADEHDWIHILGYTYHIDLHDGLHLTDTGYADVSAALMRRALEIDGETIVGSTVGPVAVSALRVGTQITLTLSHDAGTDFTPSSGIVGFRFFDGASEIAITNAVRTDATTITLTLASTPSGSGTLYYVYDDANDITDANLANVVRDNSPQTLPLVPFRLNVS